MSKTLKPLNVKWAEAGGLPIYIIPPTPGVEPMYLVHYKRGKVFVPNKDETCIGCLNDRLKRNEVTQASFKK